MDASRVMQSLDSLWFYNIILTCSDDPVPSLTHQSNPSIHAKEPPKSDLRTPSSPFLLNLQDESEILETLIPFRPKSRESETEMKDRGRRRSRRRKRRNGTEVNGMRKIHGGVELGFDMKVLTGSFKFDLQSRMIPYHDVIAMKEHLRSWAYAVACIVK